MYLILLVSLIAGIFTYYKKEYKDKDHYIRVIEGLFTAFDVFIAMYIAYIIVMVIHHYWL